MKVREVMTSDPVIVDAAVSVMKAADAMRQNDIGNVVVKKDGQLCGIVTDRDIVVRVIASGKDPKTTTLGAVCSQKLATASPDQDTSEVVNLMRERAIRRLPVVQNGDVVGIVSLGDLALAMDRSSALGDISAAPANQ